MCGFEPRVNTDVISELASWGDVGYVAKTKQFQDRRPRAWQTWRWIYTKGHSQVATLEQWGEIRELRIEHDGDSRTMEKFLGGLEAGGRIAIEATGSWWWVVDMAEKHGHDVVLSNPKKTRLIGTKAKRDIANEVRNRAFLKSFDMCDTRR